MAGLLSRLAQLLKRRGSSEEEFLQPQGRNPWDRRQPPAGPLELRRWDAATTTEFNSLQWAGATGRTLNEDLVSSLPTLIDRCTYEISINATVAGMVHTHATDICGPGGPAWQVLPRKATTINDKTQQEFTEYCAESEDLLTEWSAACDYNGELSGAEILHLAIQQQWATGNAFCQIVPGQPDSRTPVGIRLHPVHAERILKNVMVVSKDKKAIRLGIERDAYGKKTRYYVSEPNESGSYWMSLKSTPVPAAEMIHHFRTEEPGQIAGVPWLAPGLSDVGDIRQFDQSTMKAAQLAASLALTIEDKFENAPSIITTGMSAIKMGLSQILPLPKNKTARQIDPKHPASNYVEFRGERWRDVGRSVNMPLMIARLDSKDHSYASARMDRQLYWRSLEREQFAIEKRMRPVLMDVLREAELRRVIRPRPVPVDVCGIFTQLPHADPNKEASARQLDLATMSKTLIDVWAEQGIRPAEMADKIKRQIDVLESIQPGLGQAYINNFFKNANLPTPSGDDVTELLESLKGAK